MLADANDFFVILTCQNGKMTAMVDDDGELATFFDADDAIAAAQSNPLAVAFGYEVFERGLGSYSG